MGKFNKIKDKFKSNSLTIVVIAAIIISTITNVFLVYSVLSMHSATMQFIADVFYYTPEDGVEVPTVDPTVEENNQDTNGKSIDTNSEETNNK